MKFRATFEVDSVTGDYEVQYDNLGDPGQPMDFKKVISCLKTVLGDHVPAVESEQEEAFQ